MLPSLIGYSMQREVICLLVLTKRVCININTNRFRIIVIYQGPTALRHKIFEIHREYSFPQAKYWGKLSNLSLNIFQDEVYKVL